MSYVAPSKVFAHLDRLAAWQAGEKPAPVTVEWDLSHRCVLGCQDCHFAHTHTRGPWASRTRQLPMAYAAAGDLADVTLVKRGLAEMAAAGVQGVVWSGGGEPTTHPQWREIVAYAASCGLAQGMYTLGGLLTPASARELATVATWVVVSLDAADAATYAAEKGVPPERFAAACDGVRALVASPGCVIGLSFLLHADNWRQARAMLDLGRALGVTYTTFRPAIQTAATTPASCTADRLWILEARPLLQALAHEADVELDVTRFDAYRTWRGREYTTCYGIRLNATVTPDGRVWVCPQRRGVEGSCVGDLRHESFSALWGRHVGAWTDFSACRVMCRLHQVNEALATVYAPHAHEAFV